MVSAWSGSAKNASTSVVDGCDTGSSAAIGGSSTAGAGSGATSATDSTCSATGVTPAAGDSSAPPMTTMGVPTSMVSPSSTSISRIVPDAGEGTSVSTLSVEISTSTSSSTIESPTVFAHFKMVPSVTVSPSWGIVTVVDKFAPLSEDCGRMLTTVSHQPPRKGKDGHE